MNPCTIKKIIKYELLFIFALYAFAGGNNAFAARTTTLSNPIPIFIITDVLTARDQYCRQNPSSSLGIDAKSTLAGQIMTYACRGSSGTWYYYEGGLFALADTYNSNPSFFSNSSYSQQPLNPDGTPYTQATQPDISQCTKTNISYQQPLTGYYESKFVEDGCIYESSGLTACAGGTCSTDVTATGTYFPDELICPTGSTCIAQDSTQSPIPQQTTDQSFTQDAISNWWGSEPIETFQYSDGRTAITYGSLTGCTLEVIINPNGSYDELTDTCNVHEKSTSGFPEQSPEENHTNPDGSPNEGGGSGNTGAPSSGSSTGGTGGTGETGNQSPTTGNTDISGGTTDPTTTETPEDPETTSCLDGEKCEVLLTGEGDPTADPSTVLDNLIGGYSDALEAEINQTIEFDPTGQIEVIETPNLMTRQSCNAALYAADFNGFIVNILSKFCTVYESHGRPLLAWAFGFITFIYCYRVYYSTINPQAA